MENTKNKLQTQQEQNGKIIKAEYEHHGDIRTSYEQTRNIMRISQGQNANKWKILGTSYEQHRNNIGIT